jgi:transcriptional antiterminator NusG
MAFRWYIVHAHSGFEKKIAESIKEQAGKKNITHLIEEVVVPVEEVAEIRRGKKITTERKFFPGYVMVKMELTDETWHTIKNTPKVTGFLGGGGKGRPVPITEKEAESIFSQVREGISPSKSKVSFEIGENVKIIEGPFESFVGLVEGVDDEKSRVKVSVSIFGRATPVDLEYNQVEKVA